MMIDVGSQLFERLPCLLQNTVELGACLSLGFCKCHLNSAVRVDFAFARSFDWQEDHVFILVYDSGLNAIRLCGGHAAEGFESQNHMTEMIHGVVDVFAYFHV